MTTPVKKCPQCGKPNPRWMEFCKECYTSLVDVAVTYEEAAETEPARKSKPEASFESLVAELIAIGKNTKAFNEGDTYYFRPRGEGIGWGENWDARTREIGQELYTMGANKIQLMQKAHDSVVQALGSIAGRCLEAHWHEIGREQWQQGKGECWLF